MVFRIRLLFATILAMDKNPIAICESMIQAIRLTTEARLKEPSRLYTLCDTVAIADRIYETARIHYLPAPLSFWRIPASACDPLNLA